MGYRVGIIGLGRIGGELPDNHYWAYMGNPDIECVFTCDKVKGQAQYTDYLHMIKVNRLDIVSVCTPPETHCQIVCDVAPYVKAICCEKPIAITLEDADRMIETCYKHGVILQVNHQRRFTIPKMRFSRGILNTGTHAFDLLRQLFGELGQLRDGGLMQFGNQWIEVNYVDTHEPIFELDCAHNKEPMIAKGVQHLVECLKEEKQSISSGAEARETLRVVLAYQKLREANVIPL